MRSRLAATVLVALASLCAASAAEAASCAQLFRRGARVIDSYVMDFGSSDKLYVYILRMPNGSTDTCTSERRLPG